LRCGAPQNVATRCDVLGCVASVDELPNEPLS
jgi:hypothetical protein